MAKKIKTPDTGTTLSTRLTCWPEDKPIERIHSSRFGATDFNPGRGNSRFSPMKVSKGTNVPTLYGGENLAVALAETVLHDLPTPSEGAPVELSALDSLARSQISSEEELKLVDLNPRFMKKHGITQAELLISSANNYPETHKWAEKVHADNPEAQGIQWASKQHGDKAIMLFGDRIDAKKIRIIINAEPANASREVNIELNSLADEMGLVLIPENMT
ncbi:TPA: RES family NAD+ phosphorylase [Salmonella enterica]